jgi:hypothetical protein
MIRKRTSAVGAMVAISLVGLAPLAGVADVFPWQTDLAVGTSDAEITLDLLCTGGGLVCDLLDG